MNNRWDYVVEEEKSKNSIEISGENEGSCGVCVVRENECGNKINVKISSGEEKE